MLHSEVKNSKSPAPQGVTPRGIGQLWVAVLCIGLSQILSVLWLWSLISARPMH